MGQLFCYTFVATYSYFFLQRMIQFDHQADWIGLKHREKFTQSNSMERFGSATGAGYHCLAPLKKNRPHWHTQESLWSDLKGLTRREDMKKMVVSQNEGRPTALFCSPVVSIEVNELLIVLDRKGLGLVKTSKIPTCPGSLFEVISTIRCCGKDQQGQLPLFLVISLFKDTGWQGGTPSTWVSIVSTDGRLVRHDFSNWRCLVAP